MEKNKFKFKLIKPNTNNNWSSKYCKKINFNCNKREIYDEGSEIEVINNKLNDIEVILNKLVVDNGNNGKGEFISNDYDNKIGNNNNKSLIKLNFNNTLNSYEDYPTKLIKFYFIMQLHCSYPPVLNIREYYECTSQFNNNLPNYLTLAILSKSSLNSPNSQLYLKNLEFCNYFYNQCLKELNSSISKNEVSIYMIHSLLILIGIDHLLNRNLSKSNRIVSCIKLSQILGLNNLTGNSANNSTIQKLLLFLKFYDFEVSSIFNRPKLIRGKDPKYDDFIIREDSNFNDLINSSLNYTNGDLPKDYLLTFKACKSFIHLIFPKIDKLEKDFPNSSISHYLNECQNLLKYVTDLYDKLPINIKYTEDCLSHELVIKDPLLRLRLSFYNSLLRESARIWQLSIRLIDKLTQEKVFDLVKKFLMFIQNPVNLLKSQNLSLFQTPENIQVKLNLSTFYHLTNLLLDLIENLINYKNSNISINARNFICLENLVKSEFNNFIGLIVNLNGNWEGSESLVSSMIARYNSII